MDPSFNAQTTSWMTEELCGMMSLVFTQFLIKPLNAKLNPICHLLALLGAHHIIHVGRIRVNSVLRVFPGCKASEV